MWEENRPDLSPLPSVLFGSHLPPHTQESNVLLKLSRKAASIQTSVSEAAGDELKVSHLRTDSSSPEHGADAPTPLVPLLWQLLNSNPFSEFSCVQFVRRGHILMNFKS